MATRKISITGMGNYAKVFKENRDLEGYKDAYREHDGALTINMDMDEQNYEVLKDSGSQKCKFMLKDEHGRYQTKFIRKWNTPWDWQCGAIPVRVLVDGKMEPMEYDANNLIWNGSIVVCHLSVYDTSRGPGTRLEGVDVIQLADKPDTWVEQEHTVAEPNVEVTAEMIRITQTDGSVQEIPIG
jgi:hypothetical protein